MAVGCGRVENAVKEGGQKETSIWTLVNYDQNKSHYMVLMLPTVLSYRAFGCDGNVLLDEIDEPLNCG